MKNAAIIFSAIVVGIALVYLVIAILPFLIAVPGLILIWWLIGESLTGGFGLHK